MIPKIIAATTIILSGGGCASFRQPPGTHQMIAFEKPAGNCVEIYRDVDISSPFRGYSCADAQTLEAKREQGAVNLTAATPCDESLWRHIYHPARLHRLQATDANPSSCISVTGTTVDATAGKQRDGCRHEADGDGHCWLKLDKGEEGLLADGNVIRQQGNLVFEPICRYKTTQADAVSACYELVKDAVFAGQRAPLPPIGSHVRITGTYVFDAQHKHNELHPVTKIEVLP